MTAILTIVSVAILIGLIVVAFTYKYDKICKIVEYLFDKVVIILSFLCLFSLIFIFISDDGKCFWFVSFLVMIIACVTVAGSKPTKTLQVIREDGAKITYKYNFTGYDKVDINIKKNGYDVHIQHKYKNLRQHKLEHPSNKSLFVPYISSNDGLTHFYSNGGEVNSCYMVGNIKHGETIYHSGKIEYYHMDKLHNDNGPAVIDSDNKQLFYNMGLLHRVDGPAVVNPDGSVEYWFDGYEVESMANVLNLYYLKKSTSQNESIIQNQEKQIDISRESVKVQKEISKKQSTGNILKFLDLIS